METNDVETQVDYFYQRRALMFYIVAMLSFLLALVVLAAFVGPGFKGGASQYILATLACLFLLAGIAFFCWMIRKRPVALEVGAEGVNLPFTFKHPLHWSDVHRIRRSKSGGGLYGARDWLIIDLSPGVLAPLRLPVWRSFELKFQKHYGVRIPLHGLEGGSDAIVASFERFRPVVEDNG